jgi:hypothetical protein
LLTALLTGELAAAEGNRRAAASFGRGHAGGDAGFGFAVDVELELLIDVGATLAGEEGTRFVEPFADHGVSPAEIRGLKSGRGRD